MPADELTPAQIRAIRERRGLKLREMAADLGVTLRAVAHWEAGTRKPSGPALKLLRSLAGRKPARGAKTP